MFRDFLALLAVGAWMSLGSTANSQEPIYLHAGRTVEALAFSSDSTYLAASTSDNANSIVVWEVPTAKEFKVLREHSNQVHLLWWAADATTLFAVNTSLGGEIKAQTAIVTQWNVL